MLLTGALRSAGEVPGAAGMRGGGPAGAMGANTLPETGRGCCFFRWLTWWGALAGAEGAATEW